MTPGESRLNAEGLTCDMNSLGTRDSHYYALLGSRFGIITL